MKTLYNISLSFILILVCLAEKLDAQDHFAIGPSTCIGIAAQSFNDNSHHTLGWKMGISTHIPLNRVVFLGPEMYVTNKGYHDLNYSAGWFGPTIESGTKLSLYYVELSLPVKFKLTKSFYLQTGIQAGYLVHANFEIHEYDATYYDSGITDALDKYEFGVIAGMNWELKSGLGFSLIANAGITDINNEETQHLYSDNESGYGYPVLIEMDFGRNFIVTGGIHYLFPIKKKSEYVKF